MIPRATVPTFGPILAPTGFTTWNETSREEHPRREFVNSQIEVEPVLWNKILALNTEINSRIYHKDNPELTWSYPKGNNGDCRAIALLKRRELVAAGIPRQTMAFTVVLDRNGRGHVVLMLRTSRGDHILDNRNSKIAHWSKTGFVFLQRQCWVKPIDWVSLNSALVVL